MALSHVRCACANSVYNNSYLDVEVNVTFVPGQLDPIAAARFPPHLAQAMTMLAFWDGNQTWISRFAPPGTKRPPRLAW